jgi:hypothetical protein
MASTTFQHDSIYINLSLDVRAIYDKMIHILIENYLLIAGYGAVAPHSVSPSFLLPHPWILKFLTINDI